LAQQSLLEINNLSTELIGPINLTIAQGECVAILGPSGSGKSLLLRAIADLDPNDGEIRLNGQRRDEMPACEWRRLAALVPAESGWWEDEVKDHFKRQSDLASLLEEVGLPDALNWQVSRLSTGERQRLAIIRALQNKPQLLLLDEPAAALDAGSTERVEALLQRIQRQGTSILLVTHDPAQAARLASRQFTMRDGQLLAQRI
jgi:ABC-type lipoprotein export system ATPase subunit